MEINRKSAIIPDIVALPSTAALATALMLRDPEDSEPSQIIPLQECLQLDVADGRFRYDGIDLGELDLSKARDMDLSCIDPWPLRVLYSVVAQRLSDDVIDMPINEVVGSVTTINIKELIDAITGQGRDMEQERVNEFLRRIYRYQNVIGKLNETDTIRFKTTHGRYPVIAFLGYSDDRSEMYLATPYLSMLYRETMLQALIRTPKNTPKLINGRRQYNPSHSYLIKTSICKERNQRACEIVYVVCNLILQTGNKGVPHITARNIITKCADLNRTIYMTNDTSNRNKLLKRVFNKAWELLKTQTLLDQYFEDIQYPTTYPTMSSLDMTFKFPHKGKKVIDSD